MKRTNEGAMAYEHSLNHALEFFSKAGSLFTNRKSFYGHEESALSLFQKTWIVDPELSFKLLLWLRDCRGGSGNRSATRACLDWLGKNDPEWVNANIGWIPMVGRWDDLRALFGTDCEKHAVKMWANALREKDVLAAKWADRNDSPLRQEMRMKIGDFRRVLAKIRKNHIVEHKMCSRRWNEVEYEKVPSVAMARYTQAFGRNDTERFERYKEALKSGKAEVHADVLFPHDCVRTISGGDAAIADAQFEALPNFMEGTDERIIVISDTSASMTVRVAGSIRAVDVSQGLALYCSSRIPEGNPFHKKFIGFCSESKFKDWEGMRFSEAVRNRRIFDGAIGATRVDTALDLILDTAKFFSLSNEHMPTTLLIVSDMQFHHGARSNETEIERSLKKWNNAGYARPKVVYWNTDGYSGSQDTTKSRDVGLVSGFSPSVLKAILGGKKFDPVSIMMRAIEKYDVVVP